MKQGKTKAEKRPAQPPAAIAFRAGNASFNKVAQESLVEMDSDEILEKYEKGVAGGERKKRLKMTISGKSVFKIREIILKKSKRAQKLSN